MSRNSSEIALSLFVALVACSMVALTGISCGNPSSPEEPDTIPEPPVPSVLQATYVGGWEPPAMVGGWRASLPSREPSHLETSKRVDLLWTSCPERDFVHYIVLRSTEPGIEDDPMAADTVAIHQYWDDTTRTDNGIEWDQDYYYAIRTRNTDSLFSLSNEEHVYIPPQTSYGGPDQLLATIGVGGYPGGLCSLPSGAYVYVACYYSNSIYAIETAALSVAGIIPVGDGPRYVCASGGYAYSSNGDSDDVSVIDTSSQQVVSTIGVGDAPAELSATPSGDRIYVACYGSDEVWCIDTGSWTVEDTIQVGDGPWAICCLPSGEYVYVTNRLSGDVSVIRASDNTVTTTIDTGGDPRGLMPLPSGYYLYVADYSSDEVLVVRTSDNVVEGAVSILDGPAGLCAIPNGNFVYVARFHGESVSVIDVADNTVLFTLDVGLLPSEVCCTPGGELLFVSNSSESTVSVFGY
jgi:YVTN family beta-propeller protein